MTIVTAYTLALPAALLMRANVGSAHGEVSQKRREKYPTAERQRSLQGSTSTSFDGTPLPDCSSDSDVYIRYNESIPRLYVEHEDNDTRGGCVTLTEIYNAFLDDNGEPSGPLYIMDESDNKLEGADEEITGRWLLTNEVYIQDGITLKVWGADIGGDADVLRLESTDSNFFNLRAYGGSLSFMYTMVTSWDTSAGDVRDSYSEGRSYISCISEEPTGDECRQEEKDMGECRMDIIHSEMGYLGYYASESYGLTWKVRGLCEDKSDPDVPVNENEDLFDKVDVWGDIKYSEIHNMYYGMYSFGHQEGNWSYNIMRDNHQYGFDPHDDSDYLTISHNVVYNNQNHGIIASKRCNNLQVFNNEVYNNEKSGIYFHRGCDNSAAFGNYVHDNADAGVSIMESSDCMVYENRVVNQDTGVRIILGGEYNMVFSNVFENNTEGMVTYEGSSDVPWTTDGRSCYNEFYNNTVFGSLNGIRLSNGDDNIVRANTFTSTETLKLYDSLNIAITDNVYTDGMGDTCFSSSDSSVTNDSVVPDSC